MKNIHKILLNYESESPGVKANLYKILNHGSLKNTGHIIILPVDQGFEHGPIQSFEPNPQSYDPLYHIKLAIQTKLNAFAAPIGIIEHVASKYAGQIPLILKINNSHILTSTQMSPEQSINTSIEKALFLGCSGVGFTIYPGSNSCTQTINNITPMIEKAKSYGLVVVIWAYPRGEGLSKQDETAVDVIAYATHIASLLGANIIKVKPPQNYIYNKKLQKYIGDCANMSDRIKYITKSAFNNKRIVLFSGGPSQTSKELLSEIKEIKKGGGTGSIIGRNSFQRPYNEALDLLKNIINIYKSNNS